MKVNEHPAAIAVFKKILAHNENYLAAYYQLGKSYEKISESKEAVLTYQKGIIVAAGQKNQKTLQELQAALDSLAEDE